MKPLATHAKRITDFASWRGLFVMSGINNSAMTGGHIYRTDKGDAALWFGDVDDIWRMGEPRGTGGPWKNSAVTAGVVSDAYLMAGYNRKVMILQHEASETVKFKVEVDFLGDNSWLTYSEFSVEAGKVFKYEFPEGYQAHWVRLSTDRDVTATAQFVYGLKQD
jgi:hypothetical protein